MTVGLLFTTTKYIEPNEQLLFVYVHVEHKQLIISYSVMALEDEIIANLNKEIGKDLKNLKKAKICLQQHQERLKEIRAQVKITFLPLVLLITNVANLPFQLDPSDVKHPSFLKSSVNGAHRHVEELDELIDRVVTSGKQNEDKVKLFQEILDSVAGDLKKISTLQHLVEYVKIQRDIEDISEELKTSIKGRDDHKTIGLYLSLSGEYQSANSVLGRLRNIEAVHLIDFATKTAIYWHDNLKEKFSKDFESVLKAIKWPHFANMQVMEQAAASKESLNKLTSYAEYLFLVSWLFNSRN